MPVLVPSPVHRLAETGLTVAKVVAIGGLLPIALVGLLALAL
ncbi:MAG TPA: hypothetical protein VEA15_08915 [Caulobacteraceae bacterium]|nr:hypothetical protein [Caulobacteraceae bacterium]